MSDDTADGGYVSFFVIPGNALKSLSDELQIVMGEQASKETMERYGYRCGEGLVRSIGFECDDLEEFQEMMPGIMIETGLGRTRSLKVEGDFIVIEFEDSVEANAMGKSEIPSCNFTRGYLSGVVSALFKRNYDCVEEMCICKGDEVCLHKLTPSKQDIRPEAESIEESDQAFELDTATSYLVKEEAPDVSYKIFMDYVTHGHQGLCITRDFPAKVRKKFNMEKTPIIWLSTSDTENTVAPQNLSALFYQIENFLKQSENGIIMLSGMEYLISHNTYQSVLKFVQLLNEQIAIRDSILIVPLSPLTLDEKDLKMIERELETYETS